MNISDTTFAIAVCTFNPEIRLLKRLLSAIKSLLRNNNCAEFILIDNNSTPPLNQLKEVKQFFEQVPIAHYALEPRQGLLAARCKAIRETKASIVIFFDDDNEPAPNYLEVLNGYFKKYPNVGIWGPGNIEVEYVDPVNEWFYQHPEKFQHRQCEFSYGCVPATWGEYLPNGTGFAVRREILMQYLKGVETGSLRVSGRCGNNMSSAEDIQIVWEGVKSGWAAGVIPELKCKHLIPASKANMSYLKRVNFGTSSSYLPALLESFPKRSMHRNAYILKAVKLFVEFIMYILKFFLFPSQYRETQIQIAVCIGAIYSHSRLVKTSFAEKVLSISKLFKLV